MRMLELFTSHYACPDNELIHPDGVDKKEFRCQCEDANFIDTVIVMTRRGKETVKVVGCPRHTPAIVILDQGFMPAKVHGIGVAFSLAKMRRMARYREHGGVSFQAGYEAEFFTRLDSTYLLKSEKPPYYKEFLDAMREFLILEHLVWHGRFTSRLSSIMELGKRNALAWTCDGYFSAKKLDKAHGGGGNYGETAISKEYFKEASEAYRASSVPDSAEKRTDNNQSGGKTDIAAIFGTFCRHEVSGVIYDIDVGEKLSYAVAALESVRREYPNRKIAWSYDISSRAMDANDVRKVASAPKIMMKNVNAALDRLGPWREKESKQDYSGELNINRIQRARAHKAYLAGKKGTKVLQELRKALNIEGRVYSRFRAPYKEWTRKLKKHNSEFRDLLNDYNSTSAEKHQQAVNRLPLSVRAAAFASIQVDGIMVDNDSEDDDDENRHSDIPLVSEADGEIVPEIENQAAHSLTRKEIFDDLNLPSMSDEVTEYWKNLEDLVLHVADSRHAAEHFKEREKFWEDVLSSLEDSQWSFFAKAWAQHFVHARMEQEGILKTAWLYMADEYFKASEYASFEVDHYNQVEIGILSLLGGK
ncbi:hypothetical protein BC829DRAFT_414698 [Chytridium lagenaria]|nr:hypothetical protein BC829DRAFT_414698 [Chytridium lagenaria]